MYLQYYKVNFRLLCTLTLRTMESVADDDVAIDNFVVDVLNLVVSKMESPEDNNGKFSKISRSASVGLIPEKASYAGKSNDILINYNILK